LADPREPASQLRSELAKVSACSLAYPRRAHLAALRLKSSRKAATPFHALINYAYAILETEATIVLQTHGFDPGMGSCTQTSGTAAPSLTT